MSAPLPATLPGVLWQCDRCPRRRRLFYRTATGELLCAFCWRDAGEPSLPRGTMAEVAAAEAAIRDGMNRRGGADRHLLAKGRT